MLTEMLVGKPLFFCPQDQSKAKQRARIRGKLETSRSWLQEFLRHPRQGFERFASSTDPQSKGKDGADLIASLICWDPSYRVNAQKALTHPFITSAPEAGELEPLGASGAEGTLPLKVCLPAVCGVRRAIDCDFVLSSDRMSCCLLSTSRP